MEYVVHEFLSYLFIVVMFFYTWWGWTLFDAVADIENRWTRWLWLVGMLVMIGTFVIVMLLG